MTKQEAIEQMRMAEQQFVDEDGEYNNIADHIINDVDNTDTTLNEIIISNKRLNIISLWYIFYFFSKSFNMSILYYNYYFTNSSNEQVYAVDSFQTVLNNKKENQCRSKNKKIKSNFFIKIYV